MLQDGALTFSQFACTLHVLPGPRRSLYNFCIHTHPRPHIPKQTLPQCPRARRRAGASLPDVLPEELAALGDRSLEKRTKKDRS